MRLSRRRKPEPEPEPEPADETFSFFTVGETARFRALVRAAFAEIGLEVTAHREHVVDSAGIQYGLYNLAAVCHGAERGEEEWPELIHQHVRNIVSSMQSENELDSITPEELRSRLFPRLMERDTLLPGMTYGRDVAGALVEVLNLDQPETVRSLMDGHLDRLGPAGPLFDAAWQNLRGLVFDNHRVQEAGGRSFHSLTGESMSTATTMLILGEVAAGIGDPVDPELGAFVVVPFRHQVAFHVWRREDALPVDAINGLLRWAELGYSDAPGPLSPEVFWWRPTGIEQISRHTDEGVSIQLSGDLAALAERDL